MDEDLARRISGGIPVYNGAKFIARTISELKGQGLQEILVLDDGSTDGTAEVASGMGARVIRHNERKGRGAARARLIEELRTEYVLHIDAGTQLSKGYVQAACNQCRLPGTAAVFGRAIQSDGCPSAARKWSERHLLKAFHAQEINLRASLSTGAVLLNREAIVSVGNFCATKQAGEDRELGDRLLKANWKVVFNPALRFFTRPVENWGGAFERYFRWNVQERWSLGEYGRQLSYGYRSMLRLDLASRDYLSACMTIVLPHYLYIRSRRLK